MCDTIDDTEMEGVCQRFREEISVEDRKYHFKTYPQCFVGSEAVFWLSEALGITRARAVEVGLRIQQAGVFAHVTGEHLFEDKYLFYRFEEGSDHHLAQILPSQGSLTAALATPSSTESSPTASAHTRTRPPRRRHDLRNSFVRSEDPEHRGESGSGDGEKVAPVEEEPAEQWGFSPLDEHNVRMLEHIHPADWSAPTVGTERYNMVVIGAGAAGLITAIICAGLGGRVALIEKNAMGGDCLTTGCVPSKALIASATMAYRARHASDYGVDVGAEVHVDFARVMERMRRLRADISAHDSVQRFRDAGVDVFFGHGKFTSKQTVSVGDQTLTFHRACIATGGRAGTPRIPGLLEAGYLTHETLFNLTVLPRRLAVIAAGSIGCEMAQAMRRFGSEVTLFARSGRLLTNEDEDATAVLQAQFEREGITLALDVTKYVRVEVDAATGAKVIHTQHQRGAETVTRRFEVDEILIAAGRVANVNGLGLTAAGVNYTTKGVEVNDHLATSNARIFACGDVCGSYLFTHMADAMARIVVRNALFFGRARVSSLTVPWCTYTDPEVAHVGAYARDIGDAAVIFKQPFSDVDRAVLDGSSTGFASVVTKSGGSGDILGATIVGAQAGNMISELTLAIQAGVNLSKLSAVIHPYPTSAEALRQLGDQYNRTKLTSTASTVLSGVLKFRRKGK